MMKRLLLASALLLTSFAQAQSILGVTYTPNTPLECQDWIIDVNGELPALGWAIINDTSYITGTTIFLDLYFDQVNPGAPIIWAYNHLYTFSPGSVPAGSYTLTVRKISPFQGQITATNSQAVVIGQCCPASSDFSINTSTLCWNDTLFVTDLSAGTSNVNWYVNDTFDHAGAGDFYLSGLTGNVTIKQVAIDPGCSDSTEISVTVNPKPSNGFNVIQSGTQYTFTATGSSAFSYDWDFGDGTTGSGPLVSHTYAADGMYNACLTSSDMDMCSVDSCTTINFSTIGLEENTESIRIYPNPASRIVQIEGVSTTDIQWYNELGQLITITEEDASHQYIHIYDVSALPAGLYYIQWADKAEKIVIQ